MFEYWPCAIRICEDDTEEQISTYESALTEKKARSQFLIWKDYYKYNLKKCWIDLYENNVHVTSKQVDIANILTGGNDYEL